MGGEVGIQERGERKMMVWRRRFGRILRSETVIVMRNLGIEKVVVEESRYNSWWMSGGHGRGVCE